MNDPGQRPARRDRTVILARGRGRRMGAPKGTLRLVPGGPTFLETIVSLYRESGRSVAVVANRRDAAGYRSLWPAGDGPDILGGPDGGDTALTILTAWRTWRDQDRSVTHVWAHPVDLPLVRPATLRRLGSASEACPAAVLRPAYGADPGHPVVLPVDVIECLAERPDWWGQPLRSFLAEAVEQGWIAAPLTLAGDDPGVVRDFDRPEDLDAGTSSERGTP